MKQLMLVRGTDGLHPGAVPNVNAETVSLCYGIRPLNMKLVNDPRTDNVMRTIALMKPPLLALSRVAIMDSEGKIVTDDGDIQHVVVEWISNNPGPLISDSYVSSFPLVLAHWINNNCSYVIRDIL